MKKSNALLGLACGTLLAAGVMTANASDTPKKPAATVKCEGVNSCKATGACGGKTHDCSGKNACKGKGWIKLSEKECMDKKGTVKKS